MPGARASPAAALSSRTGVLNTFVNTCTESSGVSSSAWACPSRSFGRRIPVGDGPLPPGGRAESAGAAGGA